MSISYLSVELILINLAYFFLDDTFYDLAGFKYDHVIEALNKHKSNTCYICQKRGAAIECSVADCGNFFHFPCGINDNCLSLFTGDFRSFCYRHVPDPNKGKKFTDELQPCLACYNPIGCYDPVNTVISSCCLEEDDYAIRFIHKRCVLKYTRNAGYASMCITCDKMENKELWQQEMRRKGIFIPMEDAVWERDGSFKDHVKNKCEDPECKGGKQRNDVYTCFICGCHPRHLSCVGVKRHEDYNCVKCFGESFVQTVRT